MVNVRSVHLDRRFKDSLTGVAPHILMRSIRSYEIDDSECLYVLVLRAATCAVPSAEGKSAGFFEMCVVSWSRIANRAIWCLTKAQVRCTVSKSP